MLRLRKKYFAIAVLLFLSLLSVVSISGQQRGKASYYSRKAHGSVTSSGVRLHNDSLVCAHRTYPYGTLLNVKNPANGKEVVVKVIDRGPHGRGRIIDLSYEAARRLGILAAGVAMVEVSVYEKSAIPYKPQNYDIPELDLEEVEVEESDGLTPEWQHKEKQENKGPEKKEMTAKKSTASKDNAAQKQSKQNATKHKTSTQKKK